MALEHLFNRVARPRPYVISSRQQGQCYWRLIEVHDGVAWGSHARRLRDGGRRGKPVVNMHRADAARRAAIEVARCRGVRECRLTTVPLLAADQAGGVGRLVKKERQISSVWTRAPSGPSRAINVDKGDELIRRTWVRPIGSIGAWAWRAGGHGGTGGGVG